MSEFLQALADPVRLGALRILWPGGEHCVCELMERLAVSQSRMSRHMKTLKLAGVVIDRRDAQWVRYRRNPDLAPELAAVVDAVLAAEGEAPPPASSCCSTDQIEQERIMA
ncbi:MAG: ArsR family transcriptional regulator [Alphaproteobacteria bacterium]|nr:MAG: ArsR family transcriptional regulator [Alphaproteobacteria bacterium]